MLHVDKRRQPSTFLRLRNNRESKSRFTRGFRPENFDYSSSWKTTDAERAIDQNVAGRDNIDIDDLFIAQAHDCAVAVVFGDLLDGQLEILIPRRRYFAFVRFRFSFGRHRGRL